MSTQTIEYESPTTYRDRTVRLFSLLVKTGPAIGLALVVLIFTILRPHSFLTVDNWQRILTLTTVVGVAALGMTIVIISGGIDLSVGANMALTTVVVATLLVNNWSPLAAALAGIAVGIGVGLFIGALVVFVDLAPFVVTLGLWGSLRGLAKGIAHEQAVYPPSDTWLVPINHMLAPDKAWMIVPIGVWLMLVLAIMTAVLLRYTRFGRHVFAIGSNEQTARLCGVPVARTKILVYMLGGMFAALGGVLLFSFLTMGDPTTANGKELDVIAAVVIGGASLSGGQGTIAGSLVGALLMTVIANGCGKLDIPNWVQEMVTGGIIILAAIFDRLKRGKLPRIL
ncbi:MAG TPA: ABC transporter permease [Humisphaera sp.]|jgi:ribose/xylose/arabinose/galactoside ABC-type transport system permease subunit|nr:ABC transporter permease [Humisphaera sp.]